jgi:hypothetical protein
MNALPVYHIESWQDDGKFGLYIYLRLLVES